MYKNTIYRNYVEDEIKYILNNGNSEELIEFIDGLHSVDIADILINLSSEERLRIFELVSTEKASEILDEIDSETFSDLIKTMKDQQKALILDEMSKDDIVDKLGELSTERRREIINHLDLDDAEIIKKLLVYEPDIAGGIMTSDFMVLKDSFTKAFALEFLKLNAPDAETIYYVFVVDDDNKLSGVISLRELIIAENDAKIEDIMHKNVISVSIYDDQEEVAKVVSKYDLLAVPVVNNFQKIVGIITVDDIIDVLEEEATEDIMKFAGTSEFERIAMDEPVKSVFHSAKSRLPWLIITIFGGLLSASVIDKFQYVLNAETVIALFMPLLAGMGGNVGTQSSTITVRNIAVGNITGKEIPKTILHEIGVGFIVGIVCSLLVAGAAYLLKGEMILSVIVGLSMMANIITAATIGTIVPLVFKTLNIDPAVASAPFITTTIDITGLTIYFTLATIMITQFM